MAGNETPNRESQRAQPPRDDQGVTAHERTYGAFMRLVGYALAGVAVVLIGLAIFLL